MVRKFIILSFFSLEGNIFLTGSLTNGKGCLAQSAPCTSYTGDRNICQTGFTKKYYNFESTFTTSSCTERFCTDDTTSTTDSACNSFKAGCKTEGIGCIDQSKPFSDYNENQFFVMHSQRILDKLDFGLTLQQALQLVNNKFVLMMPLSSKIQNVSVSSPLWSWMFSLISTLCQLYWNINLMWGNSKDQMGQRFAGVLVLLLVTCSIKIFHDFIGNHFQLIEAHNFIF